MTLISVHQITKSFASKNLFRKISFSIDSNQRIGLVGPNGAGKSTLFKILVKKMEADGRAAILAVNNAKPTYSRATIERDSAFGPLGPLVTRSLNALRAFEVAGPLGCRNRHAACKTASRGGTSSALPRIAGLCQKKQSPNLAPSRQDKTGGPVR